MAATPDCGKDYVTLMQLYTYLCALGADTRVNLCARTAERRLIVFGSPDEQDQALPVTRDGYWNALSFKGSDVSTASELLALIEPWLEEHDYAGVMRNGSPIFLPTPSDVRLSTEVLAYKHTALNHHRSAAALLSAGTGGDPRRAYELLRERFGRRVADEAVLYAVGRRWHGKDELFRLYPSLQQHADWKRLFPSCDMGKLRRCAVDDGVFVAEFGSRPSLVDRLLGPRSTTATPTATVVVPDAGRDARHGTAAPGVPCPGDALPAACSAGDASRPGVVVAEASPSHAQTEPPVKTEDPTPPAACSCCGGRLA